MSEQTYPYSTVGALLIAPDGELLLVQSKKWPGCYSIPGGKIELGESCEHAIIREVKEETDLDVVKTRYAFTQESIFNPQFWKKMHFVMHEFVCWLPVDLNKKGVQLNEEAVSYVWVTPQKALALQLNKETYPLIHWYLQHCQKEGKIGFDNLSIQCTIGHNEEEWKTPQEILIDLKVQAPFAKSAESHKLQDTIDYIELARICEEVASAKHHSLLEGLANAILEKIRAKHKVSWGWIRIKKPAALTRAAYTLVELEMGDSWLGLL